MGKFYVYLMVNRINGKPYIGKTKMEPPEKRFKIHIKVSRNIPYYLNKNQVFPVHYALAKYGADNFDFVILHAVDSEEMAYDLERREIKERRTLIKQGGYNLAPGGEGVRNTPDIRKKKQESAWRARDAGAWRPSLTKSKAIEIKQRIMDGKQTNRELADEFGVRPQTIGRIQKNQIFKDVLASTPVLEHGKNGFIQPGYRRRDGANNNRSKFTPNDAVEMLSMFDRGVQVQNIAKRFNCSRKVVSEIVHHKHYLTKGNLT